MGIRDLLLPASISLSPIVPKAFEGGEDDLGVDEEGFEVGNDSLDIDDDDWDVIIGGFGEGDLDSGDREEEFSLNDAKVFVSIRRLETLAIADFTETPPLLEVEASKATALIPAEVGALL